MEILGFEASCCWNSLINLVCIRGWVVILLPPALAHISEMLLRRMAFGVLGISPSGIHERGIQSWCVVSSVIFVLYFCNFSGGEGGLLTFLNAVKLFRETFFFGGGSFSLSNLYS